MSKSRYYHVKDGEWIQVSRSSYKEQCCDCGLTHRLNFKVRKDGKIFIQAFRDEKATNGARTRFRKKKND